MRNFVSKYFFFLSFRKVLFPLVLLTLSLSSFSQYDFNQNCINAYNEIISLNFNTGREILNQEKTLNPTNQIPLLLENYIDFLTLSIGEDKTDFGQLLPHRSERIGLLQSGASSSPWHRHSLATIYLQWAFCRVKFGEYMMAGLDLNRAYRLLNENRKAHPDFVPDMLLNGIMNVLIGSIPDTYRWAIRLAGMDGDVDRGRTELYKLIQIAEKNSSWNHLRPEAFFYLSFIEINLHNDQSAVGLLLQSIEKTENMVSGPLLCYIKANLNRHIKRNEQVIEIIEKCNFTNSSYPFYYLEFVLGSAKLNRLDNNAAKHLLNFVNHFHGSNYIKSAYQRLAWHSLIHGDQNAYRFYISQIIAHGQAITDEDKQAQTEALSNRIPNVRLLKARLLFDGGYFEAALDTLERNLSPYDLSSNQDSLEYIYRKARIFHGCGKIQPAIESYVKTIETGDQRPYYYAGNSALQLGLIYEAMGNFEQATHYFNVCLKLRFDEYQTSIHQKAKTGLSRISEKNSRLK